MNKYTRFSARASLAIVGRRMRQMGIWETVEKHVQIKQKVIRYKPMDKMLSAFINILAGGHGMVEVNTRVRPDEALQQAFGVEGCAEQSVVSDTVNASTEETVKQMRQALKEIYQEQGFIGFAGIEAAKFRSVVEPGQRLYLLGRITSYKKKKRTTRVTMSVQGLVEDTMVFETVVSGMRV